MSQYRLPSDFLHLRQGLLLDRSGIEGASTRFIIKSSGLMKQMYDFRLCGTSVTRYLQFHCGAVLRGMGTYLKA